MHPSNYTLYQLVKYHIELTEALEYTLITYKYDAGELNERFTFLKNDYKKGFYHEIVNQLFKNKKKLTNEIKQFISSYNDKKISKMLNTHDLHTRIKYNRKLYLACASSNNILQVFLNEEEIRKDLESSLVKLIETSNSHFNLFCLFNTLNMFVSTKVTLLEGETLYILNDIDRKTMITTLNSLDSKISNKSLLNDTLALVQEQKEFNDEDAYELLNKISMECMKSEKELYDDFESFSNKLEKEIEKGHN